MLLVPMAVFVAIIGKDNGPLYTASTDLERETELQFRTHAALDVIEQKLQPVIPETKEEYLGLLYSTETHKIYGYITNTKIKFIVVVDSENHALRENEVRAMFRTIHTLYANAVCNPFHVIGAPINSEKFDLSIRKLMSGNL